MKRALVFGSIALTATLGLAAVPDPLHANGVSIGINLGVPVVPPPAIVVPAPPHFVVVPGTPVYYAPAQGVDLFYYGGRYYRHHDGAWFVAPGYRGPWAFTPFPRVPRPVLAVPPAYYGISPGHFRKFHDRPFRDHHGRGHGHRHHWKHD
jgi:hypothetical protein